MQQNYTPLPVSPGPQKKGLDVNIILMIIALAITIVLAVLLWFMIEQKRQEELDLKNSLQETRQDSTQNVDIEETTPTPVASEAAELEATPTATPSAVVTIAPTTVTPVASPSATTQ